MAASGSQPPACACARHSKARIADSWRPCGYLVSSALAHSTFSEENAKLWGWISTGARRRGAITRSRKWTQVFPRGSSIYFSEHDIDRADDGRDIGEHVPAREKVYRLQMRESRRADLALVRFVAAIGDQIDPELALGGLDRGIDFPGRHMEPLGVQFEMMDQRFHRALHLATPRRHDLVVRMGHGSLPFRRTQLVQALFHDPHRLAHFLHADAVAVVAVAVLADRDVEIHLRVAFVGLRLAQIPGRAGTAHHHPGKTPGPGVLELDHGDIDVALLEHPVVGQQAFDVVADLEKRIAERPDVVDELFRQILVDAADAEIG